jgi:hypothetical protein
MPRAGSGYAMIEDGKAVGVEVTPVVQAASIEPRGLNSRGRTRVRHTRVVSKRNISVNGSVGDAWKP